MQGGSLFCPRNTELVPTGPVPPGEAAASVCPAPGGSPATALRPHARPQLRRRLRHGGRRGGSAGHPDGRGHRLEDDRAFSSCCVKMNRTRDAPARFSSQERRGLRGRPCPRTDSSGRPGAAEGPRNGWRAPNFPGWGDTGSREPQPRLLARETVPHGPEPRDNHRPFLLRCPGPRTGRRALGGGGTIHPHARLKRCVSEGSCVGVFTSAEGPHGPWEASCGEQGE